MIILIAYLSLLVVTLLFHIGKNKSFDAGALLLTLYSVYAVFSCLAYADKNLEFYRFNITLFPILFLFLCLIIAFSPVLSFNAKRYNSIQPPVHFNLEIVAWVFILSYIIQIDYIASHLSHGLFLILMDDEGTSDLYNEMADNADKGNIGISNIGSIIGNLLYNFGVFLFYYFLTRKKRNKYVIIGLSLAILIGILEYVASGQRGGMVTRTLLLIGTFFLFRNFFDPKVKKWVKRVGFLLLSVIIAFFLSMSISRFGYREGGVMTSMNRYAGQSVLYFDKYAFDNNGLRYGDRTIPVVKQILLFKNVPRNYIERRKKYPHLYINDEVFITFVGDFCLDFGPGIAFIIILCFSTWTKRHTRSSLKRYPFHKFYLLYIAMYICVEGGSLFYQADLGNVGLAFDFSIYLFFYYKYTKRKQLLLKRRKMLQQEICLPAQENPKG